MPFDDALIDPISFVSEHVTDILFSGESIDSLIHNCILSSLNFFFIKWPGYEVIYYICIGSRNH